MIFYFSDSLTFSETVRVVLNEIIEVFFKQQPEFYLSFRNKYLIMLLIETILIFSISVVYLKSITEVELSILLILRKYIP